MASETRVYRVDEWNADGKIINSYLVRAVSQAQAVRHKAQRFAAEVATQDDLVDLIDKDVKVEKAANGSEPE